LRPRQIDGANPQRSRRRRREADADIHEEETTVADRFKFGILFGDNEARLPADISGGRGFRRLPPARACA
jgi:hypothetical protein